MRRYKHSQTATEYLILLAVVIIIALIVVAALGAIPGIGGSSRAATRSAFWDTAAISIVGAAWSASGNETLIIKNNMPGAIIVEDVFVGTTPYNRQSIFYNATTRVPITLASGQSFTYRQADNRTGFHLANNWAGGDCTAGETVTLYFAIQYLDHTTQSQHNFTANNMDYQVICSS